MTEQEILRLQEVNGQRSFYLVLVGKFLHACGNGAFALSRATGYRVLARVFGITTPIDSTGGKKQFTALAQKLLDKKNPGDYNQAIMDFGAMVCTPNGIPIAEWLRAKK